MPYYITLGENERTLGRLRESLEAKGDGTCYFPCIQCMGLNRGRLLKTIAKKYCRKYRNTEGGMIIIPWQVNHYMFVY